MTNGVTCTLSLVACILAERRAPLLHYREHRAHPGGVARIFEGGGNARITYTAEDGGHIL